MEKLSVYNAKGGVGKTTSAINFAAILSRMNKKVLIVDMDRQGNTTSVYTQKQPLSKTIGDLLIEKDPDVEEAIFHTEYKNIDLIGSAKDLDEQERNILLDTSRIPQFRLDRVLKKVKDDYDYCIIDCPPSIGTLSKNCLATSDKVVVPIKIDSYSVDGLKEIIEQIKEMREELNPNLAFAGCFLTMYTNTNVNKDIKESLKQQLGDLVFDTNIRQNVAVIESTFEAPLVFYKPYCNASLDYKKLAKEVFE